MTDQKEGIAIKVVTVVGARPQFIKAASISRLLRQSVTEVLIHTGQHYDADMSDIFFDQLEIPRPEYHLAVGSGSHGAQTARMLDSIEEVLLREQPDWMLVYGDTNSTLAGALAAAKLHIPVAHVEAGLRSFNRRMPEEINRVLTDHMSDLLFTPTEVAVQNLQREGVAPDKIRTVGDVMYDVALYFGIKAERESAILTRLGLQSGGYILATVHRAENTDDPGRLTAIVEGLAAVAREIPVVLPLHPRTRALLAQDAILGRLAEHIQLIDPVGYLDMVMLEKKARLIATDSGGVQKEAFFHRVPCVTLRDETEWVELVELGWNRLVSPTGSETVIEAITAALRAPAGRDGTPYGVGLAAEAIVKTLLFAAS